MSINWVKLVKLGLLPIFKADWAAFAKGGKGNKSVNEPVNWMVFGKKVIVPVLPSWLIPVLWSLSILIVVVPTPKVDPGPPVYL